MPTSDPGGQIEVALSGGRTVTRLPLGLAADLWWMTFVLTGTDPRGGSDPFHQIADVVRFEGPAGEFSVNPVSAGHDGSVARVDFTFARELSWLRIDYLRDGIRAESETLTLRRG